MTSQALANRAEILPPFDYASLPAEQANLAKDATVYIKAREKGMAASALEIGAKLSEVKAALGHGNFTAWLSASFAMTARTAQNYMQAATALADKSETVSYLPVSTVYEIARAPEPIRLQVVQELEAAPSPVPAKEVSNIIFQAQQAAKEEARIAKLSPAQRKREKALRAEQKAAWEAAQRRHRQAEAARERDTVRLAELLLDRFGDDASQIAGLLSSSEVDGTGLAKRLTGYLYGMSYGRGMGTGHPRTKDEWEEMLAQLDNGENPIR